MSKKLESVLWLLSSGRKFLTSPCHNGSKETAKQKRNGKLKNQQKSHGESFLTIINEYFNSNGLFFLDEPEVSLLSPQRQMTLPLKILRKHKSKRWRSWPGAASPPSTCTGRRAITARCLTTTTCASTR